MALVKCDILEITKHFLSINNNERSAADFKLLVNNISNGNPLLDIKENLDKLHLECNIYSCELNALNELNEGVLIYVPESNEFYLKKGTEIHVYSALNKKFILTENHSIEVDPIVIELKNNYRCGKYIHQKQKSYFSYFIICLFFIFTLNAFFGNDLAIKNILIFLNIAGVVLCYNLLELYSGSSNKFLLKICTISKSTCKKSVDNKFYLPLTGLLFFLSSFFLLLFFNPVKEILILGFYFTIFSLPAILILFFIQLINKQWCIICSMVHLIIITQFIAFIIYFKSLPGLILYYESIIFIILSILFTSFFVFLIKRNFNLKARNINIQSQLEFIKSQSNILSMILKNGQSIVVPEELKLLKYGSSSGYTNIDIILSPSCGYCSLILKECVGILNSNYSDISINLLFLSPTKKAWVNYLYDLAIKESKLDILDLLNLVNNINKTQRINNNDSYNGSEYHQKIINWSEANKVHNTPTIIWNNKILPDILAIDLFPKLFFYRNDLL